MAPTTIRRAITEALEDLSRDDFDKFCYQLRDRREEPRLRRRNVEGKGFLQITDVLVSTFTEPRALQVTLDSLRQINCHEVAETLDSKTKACLDIQKPKPVWIDPTFRKTSDGQLEINPSQEALKYMANQWRLKAARSVKKPEEVKAEAKDCVLSEGGDPCNDRLVLSRCTIEFGKYKDQTFKWLLENDVRYAAMLVASHQREQEQPMGQSPLMANKDYLTWYSTAYPEVLKEVRFHREYERAKEKSLQRGQQGKALVGFGRHRSMTLQDLYESQDKELMGYVAFLRAKESTCKLGSRMEDAVKYILQRDQKKVADATAARKRQTTRK